MVAFFNQASGFTAFTEINLCPGFGVHPGDVLYVFVLRSCETATIRSWPLKECERVWLPLTFSLLTLFLYKSAMKGAHCLSVGNY